MFKNCILILLHFLIFIPNVSNALMDDFKKKEGEKVTQESPSLNELYSRFEKAENLRKSWLNDLALVEYENLYFDIQSLDWPEPSLMSDKSDFSNIKDFIELKIMSAHHAAEILFIKSNFEKAIPFYEFLVNINSKYSNQSFSKAIYVFLEGAASQLTECCKNTGQHKKAMWISEYHSLQLNSTFENNISHPQSDNSDSHNPLLLTDQLLHSALNTQNTSVNTDEFSGKEFMPANQLDIDNESVNYEKINIEDTHVIGPDDILEISVWGEDDLNQKVIVDTAGDIVYPLLGKVPVEGKTIHEIQTEITYRLKRDFLVNPQVNVIILEYNSKKVILFGAVYKQGEYKFSKKTRLLKLLSMAGGVSEDLWRNERASITITRNAHDSEKNNEKKIHILLKDLANNPSNPKLNILLENKDTIYVYSGIRSPAGGGKYFFLYGEVRRPGVHDFKGEEMTILEAITLAGGFTDYANTGKVRILRRKNGEEVTIKVNIDDLLKNNNKAVHTIIESEDIIIVPRRGFF